MITPTPPAAIAVRPCRAYPQLLLWPAICIACLPLRHRFVSHQSAPGAETGNETPPLPAREKQPLRPRSSATHCSKILPRMLHGLCPPPLPFWQAHLAPLLEFAARPLASPRLRPKMFPCCKHRVCNMQHFPFCWPGRWQTKAGEGTGVHQGAASVLIRAKKRQHFAREIVAMFSGWATANPVHHEVIPPTTAGAQKQVHPSASHNSSLAIRLLPTIRAALHVLPTHPLARA
jgi:hypothetical protein